MSYSNRFTGEITITPPLTHAEIRCASVLDPSWDAHLRIERSETDTDAGVAVTYTADAIVGPEEPCNGYDVEEQIKALVGLFAEGHEFAGFIQEDPDPGFGEPPHRWVVNGREVVKVSPQIVWPRDSSGQTIEGTVEGLRNFEAQRAIDLAAANADQPKTGSADRWRTAFEALHARVHRDFNFDASESAPPEGETALRMMDDLVTYADECHPEIEDVTR